MDQTAPDIGSRLKAAREQRGLTLAQIADATKISLMALKAIERNDLDRLPGGIFTRAYIRAFAREVGVSAEIADECRTEAEAAPMEGVWAPEPDRRARSTWKRSLVSPAITAGLLLGSALFWLNTDGRPPPALPAVVPTIAEMDAAETVAVASTSSDPARVEPRLRLEIRPSAPCWVSVVSDGQLEIYRLMQPGERAVVEASEAIELRVGAPEAFEYSINGERGRPLGEAGKPVTVRITRQSYESLIDTV